jgi:Ca2+/Na+ antiporter
MDSDAGSLAIGELIGAAFFIVAIVSGSMGIIKPFQSQKITFMRDASFLTGAIMIITWIVYHQSIHWYHSILLICYYLCYVSVVVLDAYNGSNDATLMQQKSEQVSSPINDESAYLLGGMHILLFHYEGSCIELIFIMCK